jgi:hypothetical protein
MQIQWEYIQLIDPSAENISSLGLNGWEMIGLAPYQTGGGFSINGSGSSSYTTHFLYCFKKIIDQEVSKGNILDYKKEKDIHSIDYKLFLIKKYNIEKNNILNGYVVQDSAFETLDLALTYVNIIEEHLDRIKEEEIKNIEYLKQFESMRDAFYLNNVAKFGNAGRGGLLPNDWIIDYNGNHVLSSTDLDAQISTSNSIFLDVKIIRNGAILSLNIPSGDLGVDGGIKHLSDEYLALRLNNYNDKTP